MTIDWWTLFLQTVNFLLLVWLLQHFLYKPVRAVIEKRRELAEQALRKAEATDKEALKAKSMFESKSAELEKSRKALIEKAQQTAEAEAKKIVAQARKQADGIVADARKVAEERHAEALATVKKDIVETAVKIAGTILHKTTNTDLNNVFLARVLDEIDGLSKEDRARIASDQGGVEVATSMKLTKDEREAWTKALREKLHLGGAPRFSVEPALIGGAELRLTHATVRFAWSDQLDKAADILTKSETQGVKVD
jgi:F-type H+-transporting ATPase subunit b